MNARIGESMPDATNDDLSSEDALVNNNETREVNAELQKENSETKNENDVESIKSRADAAHHELTQAYQMLNRVEGQKGKLAGLREQLGIASEQDDHTKHDHESAVQRLDDAKNAFRSAMGNFGKSLVQEQLLDSDTVLTNEEILDFLYTEKIVGIDEINEQGESTSRTFAQEYEARLNSAQETQEETPVQKNIVSKLMEKYNNIPRQYKIIMGTTLAAGIGAATGGASAAVMAGTHKLTKMMFSAGAAAGADALLQKQLHKRDVKKQTTDEDFVQRAEEVARESFVEAKKNESNVEEGILMGVEKKMVVFNEMFAHQKSKNKIRIATAVVVGVSIGSGMFDVTDVQAASGIKSGSFNFGGDSMQSSGLSAETVQESLSDHPRVSVTEVPSDDSWDIDPKNTMSAGLQRESGVIPDADGKTLEADISQFNTSVETGVETSVFFAQFTKAEVFALERVDAGSVVIQAGSEDLILNRIKLQAGLPVQGESMADYLARYADSSADELTYSQKKHILSLV